LFARKGIGLHAAEALERFCYEAQELALTAPLGGPDTLVFSTDIGENAPLIRARIYRGLGFLGI
jgi:acetate kinase